MVFESFEIALALSGKFQNFKKKFARSIYSKLPSQTCDYQYKSPKRSIICITFQSKSINIKSSSIGGSSCEKFLRVTIERNFTFKENINEYTVFEIQFRSIKSIVVTRIRKRFKQIFIFIQGNYSVQFSTSHSYFKKSPHVFILFTRDISVITFLVNDLTNIWSDISKIGLIFKWHILTMWKGSNKLKR